MEHDDDFDETTTINLLVTWEQKIGTYSITELNLIATFENFAILNSIRGLSLTYLFAPRLFARFLALFINQYSRPYRKGIFYSTSEILHVLLPSILQT